MIDYSIVLKGVNPNLFEINSAKARIKAAKEGGLQPQASDVALVATEVTKAFAQAQVREVVSIEKLAKHIVSHGSVYSRGEITAVLYMAVDCIREMLLDGNKVNLGEMGSFHVVLESEGVAKAEDFSGNNITDVVVRWTPGAPFQSLRSDAEFNPVTTRKVQAAVLKATKAGKTTVDLTKTDSGNTTPDAGTNGTNPSVTPDSNGTTPGGTTPGGNNGGGGYDGD